MKNKRVDILNNELRNRKEKYDLSKKEYNFVGSEFKWTSIEEQKSKVEEIEKMLDN